MNKYILVIITAIVMALMPFYPEPHLVKQWHRIMDGSFGEMMDYLDLVIHGGPLLYLIYMFIADRLKNQSS